MMFINKHERSSFYTLTFSKYGENLDKYIVDWILDHFRDNDTLNADELDDIILKAEEEFNQEKVK